MSTNELDRMFVHQIRHVLSLAERFFFPLDGVLDRFFWFAVPVNAAPLESKDVIEPCLGWFARELSPFSDRRRGIPCIFEYAC